MSLTNTGGNTLEKTPIFYIDGGDLYHIAKKVYEFSFNTLSPFSGQPEGALKPSAETLKLIKDTEFKSMVEILAQPALKISLRRGGLNVPTESSAVYIQNIKEKQRVVYLKNNQDRVTALLFESVDSYVEYFVLENAINVTTLPTNLIKPALSLGTITFLFNLFDCYRRAYLNGMLSFSTEMVEAIYEDEFIAILEQELKSNDIRWLLPSLFRLVPGLAESKLNLELSDLEKVESMNFISRAQNAEENRSLYLLGSSGKFMGLEFTLFWKQSVGFEITALSKGEDVETIGRYYFATTDEANHLLSFEPTISGIEVTHLAFNLNQLESELKRILSAPFS